VVARSTMKGLIFDELVQFVERNTSVPVAELIISEAGLENDGAFTSVGNYSHSEAIKLVVSASRRLDLPVTGLMRQFGQELFAALISSHQQLFVDETDDAFSFLSKIQNHIHVEVAKLYPESSPPQVRTSIRDGTMTVEYKSHRPFAMIAMGLIEGCCAHFHDDMLVELRGDPDEVSTEAIFTVMKSSVA